MVMRTAFEALERQIHGTVIHSGHPAYDDARKVYNGMIDRRPAAIVSCADVHDVMAAVREGVASGLPLAVRGGGHNAGGLGIWDDSLVVDLAGLKRIHIDAEARTARVEAGCLWREVDAATHRYGMAVPCGFIGSTGVAGLTLGGGTGHLTRRFGLTIDSLLAAEVVLANGEHVHASEGAHPDLFWALRGGGGNFGVVTSFEFRMHPVDTVLAGPTFWPLERTREIMQWYRDFILDAPEDLNGFFALMTVPPVAPFPPELHGQKVCAVVWCWLGPQGRAEEIFAPVRALSPVLFGVQEMPFPALNSVFDPLYPPGLQWYWRGDFLQELPDEAIEQHVRFAEALPTPFSAMHLYPSDGAAQRVDRHATAYSYREANWNQVIVGVSPDPAEREHLTRWTKDYWSAVHPTSLGGAYVNFLMNDEGASRVASSYRDNLPRLRWIKRLYDPDNHFRINQNIRPEETVSPQPGAPA